jgi:long-chain acyl-CoA synthetase
MAENYVGLLDATARRFPDATALRWDGGGLAYGELLDRASRCAAGLRAAGVGPGARVAFGLPNSVDFAVALLAVAKLGATAAPLDPRLTVDERAAILTDLAPVHVLDEVTVGTGREPTRRMVEAPALILYTSGSTGQPKGAIHGHPSVAFAMRSWAGPIMGLGREDRVLAALPLSHAFGIQGALLAPLAVGASIVLLERFTAEAAIAALLDHAVTIFPGVATMFQRVLASPALPAAGFPALKFALSGAAPCPWEIASAWRERVGVRILRGYGMTELFRPISYLVADPTDLPDAIGRAAPGVRAQVVDDGGRVLPPGESGELLIRTPSGMDAYLNAGAETRAVLDDGWFRTGDLATITAEGWVRIVGRKRERILRGGYSVFPSEVEAVLLAHPAVAEAAVVGRPDPELGEDVFAVVVLREGADATPGLLVAWCRERLAAFKYPRQIRVAAALPKSATGKVLKRLLVDSAGR